MDTCHYMLSKPTESTLRVNLMWGMMCQWRFISCNKCTTLEGDVDDGEGVRVWGQGLYEKSIPSSQFCCDSKAALKNKILKDVGGCYFIHSVHSMLSTCQVLCSVFRPLRASTLMGEADTGRWKNTVHDNGSAGRKRWGPGSFCRHGACEGPTEGYHLSSEMLWEESSREGPWRRAKGVCQGPGVETRPVCEGTIRKASVTSAEWAKGMR